jgi:hypothetical protein
MSEALNWRAGIRRAQVTDRPNDPPTPDTPDPAPPDPDDVPSTPPTEPPPVPIRDPRPEGQPPGPYIS